jgi:hypothetical protein
MDLLGPSELLRAPTRRAGRLLIVPIRMELPAEFSDRTASLSKKVAEAMSAILDAIGEHF